jgi:sec-independent protein translocase protein TatA
MLHLLAFHLPFIDQSAVLLILGLLIFGKRLPEVGRSLGKGIVEFKRGIKGIEDEVEAASSMPVAPPPPVLTQQTTAQPAYKYDPHTGQPIQPPAQPAMKFDPYTGKPLTPGAVPTVVEAEMVDAGSHTPV